ncbi:MAG: phosphoribosylformylglycinamidine synthase subunit PurQ, partial [Paracoccaceae bacterium]
RGGHVLGICNGFQVLTETGLLPGALMRNAGLKFICKDVDLEVKSTNSAYTSAFRAGQTIRVPVAHHDGNYVADDTVMERLRGDGRIAFTYRDNPNGSRGDIAGIVSANRRVLGMMPHPERSNDVKLGGNDGSNLFDGICSALTAV